MGPARAEEGGGVALCLSTSQPCNPRGEGPSSVRRGCLRESCAWSGLIPNREGSWARCCTEWFFTHPVPRERGTMGVVVATGSQLPFTLIRIRVKLCCPQLCASFEGRGDYDTEICQNCARSQQNTHSHRTYTVQILINYTHEKLCHTQLSQSSNQVKL